MCLASFWSHLKVQTYSFFTYHRTRKCRAVHSFYASVNTQPCRAVEKNQCSVRCHPCSVRCQFLNRHGKKISVNVQCRAENKYTVPSAKRYSAHEP